MVAVFCEVRHLSPGRITRAVTGLWFRHPARRASRQKTLKNDIKKTMKEIPHNTAGAIGLTGHLRAKRPGESIHNARCLHRCTGDAHTRGPGNDQKKSWRLPQ